MFPWQPSRIIWKQTPIFTANGHSALFKDVFSVKVKNNNFSVAITTDFKKAIDSTYTGKMIKILRASEIPNMLKAMEATYTGKDSDYR